MQEGVAEKETHPELENSKSLPVLEKTMTATSESQRMASSCAFLNKPVLRLEKVTCLLLALSIRLISIFPRPIEHAQLKNRVRKQSLRFDGRDPVGLVEEKREKRRRKAFYLKLLNREVGLAGNGNFAWLLVVLCAFRDCFLFALFWIFFCTCCGSLSFLFFLFLFFLLHLLSINN